MWKGEAATVHAPAESGHYQLEPPMSRAFVALIVVFAALLIGCGGEVKNSVKTPMMGPPGEASLDDLKSPKKGLRVLFVGNSHTFTNNVPDLVAKLAQGADVDRPLMAKSEAPGGTSFQMHWNNGRVQQLLGDVKWDLVVLQDQSAMPNLSRQQRQQETLPFARMLNEKIKESGARTVLFMTWGYRDDPAGLQRARDTYQELAADLKADLVPVGTAWEKSLAARPDTALWGPDGNHASMSGSYLAACAFFAAFYGKSPAGNSFTAGLDADEARFLQETAAGVIELKPGGLAALAPGRQ